MSPEENPNPNPNPKIKSAPAPAKRRRSSLSDLKQLMLQMRVQSLSNSTTPPSEPESDTLTLDDPDPTRFNSAPDYSSLLSDELLLTVLSKVPEQKQHISNSLVCKRWCRVSGKLVRSIKLLDWDFLESGRLSYRFPGLIDVDLVPACVKSRRNSGILMSHKLVSLHLDSGLVIDGGTFVRKDCFLGVDGGVKVLVEGCVNLRRLALMNATEEGLGCLREKCETLQELELHCCDDFALQGLVGCRNLQILKLVGCIEGLYNSMVSDIGLTILAQGCRRLVKLELVGCEGSYDGVKAIGQCCQMLEELILCDHRMDGGWLSALSYCSNLKTLKLLCCKVLDSSPGPDEHLGSCSTLEELHLKQCQLRDKQSVRALFLVCQTVRELVIGDCWGLDNTMFAAASVCRSLRFLSLEGCSVLTTEGLDLVVQSWTGLERLRVVSCNNIKDSEITPELATLFSVLKELKWRPDSRSFLSLGLEGTGIGLKGGRSLRRK